MIDRRVSRYLTDPASEDWNRLAMDAFTFQYRRILPLRRLVEHRGLDPHALSNWQEVPLVPCSAFKSLELRVAPSLEVFRSSGTTDPSRRSVHHHPFPDLYRQTIDLSFPAFCLPRGGELPILSLVPPRSAVPDSSLSFMADHVLHRHGTPESLTAWGPHGVEVERAAVWLEARQDEGRPVLVLATVLALVYLLSGLEDLGRSVRLAEGSVVFETGGFKGRIAEIARPDLLARVEQGLGVARRSVVREYGMTELTSQAYTRVLQGGDPDLFVTPHWMRVHILDPETLRPAPPGRLGLVAVFDLANVGSALHLLTEDLGVWEGEGFRLAGRATGAELRGCSLTAEELTAAGSPAAARREADETGQERGVRDG